MKSKLLAIAATALFAGPLMAQETVVISGTMNNGNLENTDSTAPFLPPGGSISTEQNNTPGGSQSLEIDLTANNAEGQWKGWADNGDGQGVVAEVPAGGAGVRSSVFIYVPMGTSFGTGSEGGNGNTNFIITGIEAFDPNITEGNPWGGGGFFSRFDLTAITPGVWTEFVSVGNVAPERTMIRTRGWNINTRNIVNGKEAFDNGGDPDNKATPADWNIAGYAGSIFLDDISLSFTDPPPPGVAILGDVNNGNIEAESLGNFGQAPQGYQSISTEFNNTDGGSQSLEIDLTVSNGNQWKGVTAGSDVSLNVSAGDFITAGAFVYIPEDTVFGTNDAGEENTGLARFILNVINGDNVEFLTGALELNNIPRGQWTEIRTEGFTEIDTVITTNKWFLASGGAGGVEPTSQGYSGSVFFDDFQLTAGPPPASRVIIGGDVRNGNLEDTESTAPFTAGVISDFTRPAGGDQSLEVSLTQTTDFMQWKGLVTPIIFPVLDPNETVTVSAWIYVPGDAELGAEAEGENPALTSSLSFGLRGLAATGNAFTGLGGPFVDLKAVERDSWIQIQTEAPIDIPATFVSGEENVDLARISLEGWNLARTPLVGANRDIMSESATPADFMAAGYNGSIFIDDVEVTIARPDFTGVRIDSIERTEAGTSLAFTSTVGDVDVYVSTTGLEPANFSLLEFDVEESPFVDDETEGDRVFYIFTEAGTAPEGFSQ